jgi:Uma2 family endonuclease
MSEALTPDTLPQISRRTPVSWEWIDGRAVERRCTTLTSFVSGNLMFRVTDLSERPRPIWVAPAYPCRCFPRDPEMILRPSVAFVDERRIAAKRDDHYWPLPLAPDLVAEIDYRADLVYPIEWRRDEWFKAGVKQVWEILPEPRVIRVHLPDGVTHVLGDGDTLTAGDAIPGFSTPVARVFETPWDRAGAVQ